MLRSDICRRAETGGILESMLGSRVTSAFMSLRSSSSWFSTAPTQKTTQVSLSFRGGRSRETLLYLIIHRRSEILCGSCRADFPAAPGLGLSPNGSDWEHQEAWLQSSVSPLLAPQAARWNGSASKNPYKHERAWKDGWWGGSSGPSEPGVCPRPSGTLLFHSQQVPTRRRCMKEGNSKSAPASRFSPIISILVPKSRKKVVFFSLYDSNSGFKML